MTLAQRPVRTCENSTIIEFDFSVGSGRYPAAFSSSLINASFCMSGVSRHNA